MELTAASSAPAPPPRRSWCWARWSSSRRCAAGDASRPRAKQLVVPGDLSHPGAPARRPGCGRSTSGRASASGRRAARCAWASPPRRRLPGEVWLSSQNRNYENRMGEGSLACLASAATVAASAAATEASPIRARCSRAVDQDASRSCWRASNAAAARGPHRRAARSRSQLPRQASARAARQPAGKALRGRVQRFGDHVDTDAIIPGEFCHLTSSRSSARKAFHYVRPEFVARAQQGRHDHRRRRRRLGLRAARASRRSGRCKGAGIQAVIAKSYAFIHKRNLVNEALPYLVVTDDAFYEAAGEGAEIAVDLARGTVTARRLRARLRRAAPRPGGPGPGARRRPGACHPAPRQPGLLGAQRRLIERASCLGPRGRTRTEATRQSLAYELIHAYSFI